MAKNQLKSVKECKSYIKCVVTEFPCLLSINVSQNQIEDCEMLSNPDKLKYLQIANFSQNQIKEMPMIRVESLYSLSLSTNNIASAVNFPGHPKLKILDIKKNKFVNLEGISNMPCLEELYAGENEIVSLKGLENLPSLKKLHLRKNPVFDYVLMVDC